MPPFQPEEMLAALERHAVRYVLIGGVAATLHGSPLPTRDADICPSRDGGNLDRLAAALRELVRYDLGHGLVVPTACLEDVIRSKEAANREKDRLALPTLRLLLEKSRDSGREIA